MAPTDETRSDLPHPRPRLVYVLSSPHSGSTVLGIVLNAHPDLCFAGELFEIPSPVWTPGRACSCGVDASECPFWGRIRERFEAQVDLASFRSGQRRYEGWRSLFSTRWHATAPSANAEEHARRVRLLVREVARASARPVVIDSSKDASRALLYLFAGSDTLDVRFLHLVRNGQGVVGSRRDREIRVSATHRSSPLAVLQYSALWVLANLLFVVIFRGRRERYLRVRYEDFLRRPEDFLRRLGDFLDVDLSSVADRLTRGESFRIGHLVAGNRLRLGEVVRIEVERAGRRPPLTPGEARLYRVVAGWFASLLGY